MLEINLANEYPVPCLIAAGRIDTITSPEFDRAVQLQTEKNPFLIIDLGRCNYLSSTGIRVLLSAFKKLKAKGGSLYISQVLPEVFQVLEMAGLHTIFNIEATTQVAAAKIEELQHKASDGYELQIDGQPIQVHLTGIEKNPALYWTNEGIAGYNELGFSIGEGIPADQMNGDGHGKGLFVSTGNCAGFIPHNKALSPDFRIPHQPAQAGIVVDNALSFGMIPTGWLRLFKPSAITLQHLAETIYANRSQFLPSQKGVLAFIAVNFNHDHHGLSCCLLVDEPLNEQLSEPWSTNLYRLAATGFSLVGATFECEELPQPSEKPSFENMTSELLTLENIVGVKPLDGDEQLNYPLVWLFSATNITNASNLRIILELPAEGFSEPEKSFLARRLYTDSKRVVIKALHGGYSAQTFQVTSYDMEGRKLRPTVLKMANRAMITREAERCQQYASPYILNNSAQVLGTEFFGDIGALRYNFVGIGGEQTQLKWLTHYFDTWPVEKLLPLFDKTFLQILNPWYGQPVKRTIFPFKDHDPTLTFFPHIFETAQKELAVSCDEPYITLEETGQKLVNPYWFLKHEYKQRQTYSLEYNTTICHGDLNMQNILLDQTMNVYLIDFSETRPRAVVADFARLEAIFMVERAPLNDDDEMKEMIEFANGFYGIDFLDQVADKSYQGKFPEIVERNVVLTRKMRAYALQSNNGDTNLAPYYMALLEWVLPIVCFYATPRHKRFSMIVAGLLCQKVMEETGKE
jgi:anti-anti-sigma factor